MPSSDPQGATARLLIRAASDSPRTAARVQALLGRLRMGWGVVVQRAGRVTARIDIRDLQGRRVLEIGEAQPPLDLDLPAGTYHLRVEAGGQRRLYTIVLEPGTCFELPVHVAARELVA